MTKEFNAETCTAEEGIINCLEVEIENAETDKDKTRIAKSIKDAVKDKHINADDANKLLAKLGEAVEPSPANDKTANEDRLAWEQELAAYYRQLRTAKMQLKDIKDNLKAARGAVNELQGKIDELVGNGSKGFKSGRLF